MTDRYPTIDPAELEPEYSEHHRRLLNNSVPLLDIAYQLAIRDREIARLEEEQESEAVYGAELARCEARLKSALEKLDDCGQDVVCVHPPGCQRHMLERNRELVSERDAALARVRELETFIEKMSTVDHKAADKLIKDCESRRPWKHVTDGCDVTNEQLIEMLRCARFWFGYWDQPATHVHKDLESSLVLKKQRDEAAARVAELESEAAAISDALMPASEWIGEAHSASEAVGNLARRVMELEADAHHDIAALEARIRELTEWRPMETAPNDGTRIELAFRVGLDEFERWETEVGYFGRTANGYASSGWQDSHANPFFASPHFWRPVRELPEVPRG